jgi:glycerol-3-phosphate dehydrogenase
MTRDAARLGAQTFDVLVAGGGVGGLTIAYDAALRGLSVALVERDDFGSAEPPGSSWTLDVRRPRLTTFFLGAGREWIRERRTLARIVPYAIQQVSVALPLYRSVVDGRLANRFHLMSEHLLALDRNRDVPRSLQLPAPRVISRGEAAERFPGLRRQGLTGAALWYEYLPPEPDRMTLIWARAASRQGAVLANYVEIAALRNDGRRVVGADATDRLTGARVELHARVVVDATGGDTPGSPGQPPRGWSKIVSLVTRREAGGDVLGGWTESGRLLLLFPWRGRALVGTWDMAWPPGESGEALAASDLGRMVGDANRAFPTLDLTPADIAEVHVRRLPGHGRGNSTLAIQDPATAGVDGLVTVAVAEGTTARAVAERVTDLVVGKLGRSAPKCRTALVPLPGGDFGDAISLVARIRRDYDAAFPSDTIPHLVAAYGSEARDVLSLAMSRPAWQARPADTTPVIGAQLAWAARHEMAMTLEDAVMRRTPLGTLGLPGDASLVRAADILGEELGWPPDRREQEIARFRASHGRYGTSNASKT